MRLAPFIRSCLNAILVCSWFSHWHAFRQADLHPLLPEYICAYCIEAEPHGTRLTQNTHVINVADCACASARVHKHTHTRTRAPTKKAKSIHAPPNHRARSNKSSYKLQLPHPCWAGYRPTVTSAQPTVAHPPRTPVSGHCV